MRYPAAERGDLPERPGIYHFFDTKGNLLYIGKATSLRDRIAGHYSSSHIPEMIPQISEIEIIVTKSPEEALVLERSLIKSRKPPFNVQFRDDKSYPYIAISKEEFPKIRIERNPRRNDWNFGPIIGGSAKRTLKLMRRIFGIRTCPRLLPQGCMHYYTKHCLGPCIDAVTPEEYRDSADKARRFLRGGESEVRGELEAEMWTASEAKRFERAAQIRDCLRQLDRMGQGRRIISMTEVDEDYLAIDPGAISTAAVLHCRNGEVAWTRKLMLENTDGVTPAGVQDALLERFYAQGHVPPVIHLEYPVSSDMEATLRGYRGAGLKIRFPKRGDRRDRLDLAVENARLHRQEYLRRQRKRGLYTGLEELQEHLDLDRVPERIEGYDISNLGRDHIVASLVVFQSGVPRKTDYKRYRVKRKGQDDLAALREVMRRRLAREELELPDLFLIDGGRGQFNAIWEVLAEEGVEVPMVSLAKKEEIIMTEDSELVLQREDPGLQLLQRVRDEAHRFAITYHRRIRDRAIRDSALFDLPGVGRKRGEDLLRIFGSLTRLKKATAGEIRKVPGFGKKRAEEMVEALKTLKAAKVRTKNSKKKNFEPRRKKGSRDGNWSGLSRKSPFGHD